MILQSAGCYKFHGQPILELIMGWDRMDSVLKIAINHYKVGPH